MKTFESPLPPTLFLAREVAQILNEMNLRGDRAIVLVRQWVTVGLFKPAGVVGRPSRTAPQVYSVPQVFLLGVLLALNDLGINESALLSAVIEKAERDLGGETQIERIWHAVTGPIRAEWLMRIDVVRPEPGERVIAVHLFDSSTPKQFWPEPSPGKYSGSLFVDLSHVAWNVEAGIAKVLASEGED